MFFFFIYTYLLISYYFIDKLYINKTNILNSVNLLYEIQNKMHIAHNFKWTALENNNVTRLLFLKKMIQ
jgi:hypothetical protein